MRKPLKSATNSTIPVMNTLQVGDRLDHYRIESLAAEGGMASIYRALDLQTGMSVAIKVPRFEAESDPVFFERFKREEEIGRRLDNPGVMKVLADGNGDRSRVYMVMEWLEGRLLRKVLSDEKKLPPQRATVIALRICEALEYIHSHGVVHRDLKPENIMVDSEDRIRLIDFGIAGSAGARRLTFGKFTHSMGTPDYVAPEQVKSKRGDARSDVYALGVIFYEMLTGEMPFEGPNALVVLNDRLVNHPIPPRERDPEISPQLQEIIYRALERNPANRYANAREFGRDLKNPDSVGVSERSELQHWKQRRSRRSTRSKLVLFYATVALIPIVIMVLLLISARRH
jgi:eukaryotic-like serine/threonine-protein kinase